MNKFKQAMSKFSNSHIFDTELHNVDTNQKAVKPISDNFLGQLYKVHFNTTRKLKIFKSVSWYTPPVKFIGGSAGTYFFFSSDDAKKLASDAYNMIQKIKADHLKLRLAVSREYELSPWLASDTKRNLSKLVSENMTLEIVHIVSSDRCFLYYNSKYHANERLKAQYYFRTRQLTFNIES